MQSWFSRGTDCGCSGDCECRGDVAEAQAVDAIDTLKAKIAQQRPWMLQWFG